jgi:tRNA A37 threonylcarbamoyladenosine synthetase subunit TsaC/SUA5/YrdC
MDRWQAPLISTSVNVPGGEPARSGDEVMEVARAVEAGPELLVLDAGRLPDSAPSTIVDCTGDALRAVREGSVPVARLRCAVPVAEERHG